MVLASVVDIGDDAADVDVVVEPVKVAAVAVASAGVALNSGQR